MLSLGSSQVLSCWVFPCSLISHLHISEAVPDNSENDVKVAVAKNFEELVTNSEKDVLVEFYAPW